MDGILREGPSIFILPSINHRDCHSPRCAGVKFLRDCTVGCHRCEVLTGTDETGKPAGNYQSFFAVLPGPLDGERSKLQNKCQSRTPCQSDSCSRSRNYLMAGGKRVLDKHNEQALFAVSASTIKVERRQLARLHIPRCSSEYLQIKVKPILY